MLKPLAVVTMVFNEKSNLRRWMAHYSKQVRGDHSCLHVVDHGSTDGSTFLLDAVVHHLSREAGGEKLQAWRAEYISDYCQALFREFESVLYVDCDEIVVADPDHFSDLVEFSESDSNCNATIGYDVLHDFSSEPALFDGPVLAQRKLLLFVAAMCKPTFLRSPARFGAGFHCSTEIPVYKDLYRFHLRYADLDMGLERLAVTRSLERPEMKGVPVDHQKISDETFSGWLKSWSCFPLENDDIGSTNRDFVRFLASLQCRPDNLGIQRFDYGFRAQRLVAVPSRFRDLA